MNNEELNGALSQVAYQVFENLAFILASEPPETSAAPDMVTAIVAFTPAHDATGKPSGGIVLSLPHAGVGVLGANMLGLDEGTPLSPDEQADAMKEVANVLCGNLLPALFGAQAEYHVAPPKILEACKNLDEPLRELCQLVGAASSTRSRIWLEFGPADVVLCMGEGVATVVTAPAGA